MNKTGLTLTITLIGRPRHDACEQDTRHFNADSCHSNGNSCHSNANSCHSDADLLEYRDNFDGQWWVNPDCCTTDDMFNISLIWEGGRFTPF